jgi:hypothetical protein
MYVIRAVVMAGCLGVAASASAQQVFFRANFSPSAAPLHGFSSIRDTYLNSAWSLTSLPGAGPNGTDAVDINLRGVGSPTENYVGWYRPLGAEVPQGATRYIRMKIKLVGPISYQSVGSSGSWSTKMVILGDGGESQHRVMWNLRSGPSTSQPIFVIEKNIDGGSTRISTNPLPVNQWIAAQLRIRSSSTTSSGNGQFALYMGNDNANESTPTMQSGNFSINTADWDQLLGLGYYCDYMRSAGHVQYQFAAFEVGDRFDPLWHIGSSSGDPASPTAPTNVRIVSSAAIYGVPTLLALSLLLRPRRKDDSARD